MHAVVALVTLLCALSIGVAPAGAAPPPGAPVVGFLGLASPEAYADRVAGVLQGLKETGYIDGQNVVIEYRWAHGRVDQLPALASELVRRRVNVIVASGSTPAALAAKAATSTIPIVFGTGGDPVKEGLVVSLSRPGGNATGTSVLTEMMAAKRLELFRELVSKVEVIGVLANPASAPSIEQVRDIEEAARTLGQRIHVLNARSDADFGAAFATIVQRRIGALVVVADPMFYAARAQIVARAHQHGVPAVYPRRDFVTAGGLMSYGPDVSDIYRQQGLYAGRILNGARPDELPVVQPTRFQLIINRKSAAALGVKIPESILLRATEVIE